MHSKRAIFPELSAGVGGMWYPTDAHYNAASTGPVAFTDPAWKAVIQVSQHSIMVHLFIDSFIFLKLNF